MENAYAVAIANNDDARIAEKVVEVVELPPAFYETDEGKVRVNTTRRQRRKQLITREQEIAQLLTFEIPDWLAVAIADNDDTRIAEAARIIEVEVIPLYETDAGKVSIDTIRRQRRKLLLTRADEVQQLLTLDMPKELAQAYANNDDARLAEKAEVE